MNRSPLFPLLCLGLLAGCGGDGVSSATISQPNVKPPEAVVRSVASKWPGARIASAERIYDVSFNPVSWGDYSLTLEIPGRPDPVQSTLRADGTVLWSFGSQGMPIEPAGKKGLGPARPRALKPRKIRQVPILTLD